MTLKPKWTSGLVGEYERSLKQLKTPEQPPQRTWVNATTWRGLTDEERNEITNTVMIDIWQVARAIEAKLKEKNT